MNSQKTAWMETYRQQFSNWEAELLLHSNTSLIILKTLNIRGIQCDSIFVDAAHLYASVWSEVMLLHEWL